ncbi:hypothetical protein R3P38DRAFT_2858047, partial [Favolaschia claudopus]
MDFVHKMEDEYGRPAKEFLLQSYVECPIVTSIGVTFCALSFFPLVSSIALALIVCFVAATAFLLAIIALSFVTLLILAMLGLVLSATLSFAFASAALVALFTNVINCPKEVSTTNTPPNRASPRWITFESLKSILRVLNPDKLSDTLPPSLGRTLTQKRTIFTAFILLRNPLARIFLPRWMRYHPLFPYVFGRNQKPHPLKWVILRPLHSVVFRPVHLVLKLLVRPIYRLGGDLGWDSVFIAVAMGLMLSPFVRNALFSAAVDARDRSLSWFEDDKTEPVVVGGWTEAVDSRLGGAESTDFDTMVSESNISDSEVSHPTDLQYEELEYIDLPSLVITHGQTATTTAISPLRMRHGCLQEISRGTRRRVSEW